MKLLRENIEKQRSVYKLHDRIRKVWPASKMQWAKDHVDLLNKLVPNYVLGLGVDNKSVWIDYAVVPGVTANSFEHTPEFVNKIYNFCLENIKQTSPYVHGDWALSNILIDGDNIAMCDWDNLGIYPEDEIVQKLHQDLTDSFGQAYTDLVK